MTQPGTNLPLPEQNWAYFFDIDGTLVDIALTPNEVRVDRDLYYLIAGLYYASARAVALISGRAIRDIDQLFPDTPMPVAGQHGLERRDASGCVSRHGFPSERLDEVRRALTDIVGKRPGLLLEDKGLSLALHYRAVPELGGEARGLMQSLLSRMGPEYCVLNGKGVVEMKPAGRDKGDAVFAFMREAPFAGRTPVFIGDDVTDEYGFAAVNTMNGHSVKVGPGETVARWRLPNVRAVLDWLQSGVG